MILEQVGITANVQHGWFIPEDQEPPTEPVLRHARVASDRWIVDVTTDQFGEDGVVVTSRNDARHCVDVDVAHFSSQIGRKTEINEVWDGWMRSPARERLTDGLMTRTRQQFSCSSSDDISDIGCDEER